MNHTGNENDRERMTDDHNERAEHGKRHRGKEQRAMLETTVKSIISILNKLKPYNATYASIARMYGVSSTRIMDIFDTFVRIKRHALPRVLLIDEFHFSRSTKYKYPSILMNFENNLIVDIVESRTHDIMSDYFFKISLEERKKVEYICTDMSFVFKPLLKTYFPNSTLLIDHFHVIRLINDQLNHT